MDPYLEDPAFWEGFHLFFIAECTRFLSERLPDQYVANPGEHIRLVSTSDAAAVEYVPDVALARERANVAPSRAVAGGTAVMAESVTIPALEAVEVREGYIEILRLPDYELVTSIELLSPSNKFGEGIGAYRGKRTSLVRQGVHVVEIDLLRRGRRTELARPLPAGDYYAFVFRGDRRPDVDVYAWRLRDRLPTLPVPLRKPDPDVPLDLAAVVAAAYDHGYYARKLRYGSPPPGPLSADDERWAADLARTVLVRR